MESSIIHIPAEVVLANLLANNKNDNGISIDDIMQYYSLVSKIEGLLYDIVFNINTNDMNYAVIQYPKLFYKFQDRYYCKQNAKINLHNFNGRYSQIINYILTDCANNLNMNKEIK